MKYYKMYKKEGAEKFEISKEEAYNSLERWWNKEALDKIFKNNNAFRLFTPYCDVWAETEDGIVPIAGFYGIAG